jgi:hypothetical protein
MHRDERFEYLLSQVRHTCLCFLRLPRSLSAISRQPSGGFLPPVVPAVLFEARHAEDARTMAGLLLRVDGHVRGHVIKFEDFDLN